MPTNTEEIKTLQDALAAEFERMNGLFIAMQRNGQDSLYPKAIRLSSELVEAQEQMKKDKARIISAGILHAIQAKNEEIYKNTIQTLRKEKEKMETYIYSIEKENKILKEETVSLQGAIEQQKIHIEQLSIEKYELELQVTSPVFPDRGCLIEPIFVVNVQEVV